MPTNNPASVQQATPALILIFTNSDISVTSLRHNLIDMTWLKWRRCCGATDMSLPFDLLLIDIASLTDTECMDVLRKVVDKPVALINANQEFSASVLQSFPWVRGVFYKNTARHIFRDGIERMLAGGDWLPRTLMEALVARYRILASSNEQLTSLTYREKQILRLAGKGLSNGDIADRINLSIHTVKSHVHNALYKLGAANRAHAAAMVIRHLDETEA